MVFEKIQKLICEQLKISEDRVTIDTTIDDLGVDSLDLVELVMDIEEEFYVEVPDDSIETIKTVGDLVKFVEDAQ